MKCAVPRKKEIKALETCVRKGGTTNDKWCEEASWRVAEAIVGRKLEEYELPYGAYRRVVPLGKDCVIKLAKDRIGAESNISEYENWKRIKSLHNKRIQSLFVPVLSYDPKGAWLIMPRVSTDVQPGDDRVVEYKLMNLGVDCEDVRGMNVGKLKGKLVVLDYGLGLRCDIRRRRR